MLNSSFFWLALPDNILVHSRWIWQTSIELFSGAEQPRAGLQEGRPHLHPSPGENDALLVLCTSLFLKIKYRCHFQETFLSTTYLTFSPLPDASSGIQTTNLRNMSQVFYQCATITQLSLHLYLTAVAKYDKISWGIQVSCNWVFQ